MGRGEEGKGGGGTGERVTMELKRMRVSGARGVIGEDLSFVCGGIA